MKNSWIVMCFLLLLFFSTSLFSQNNVPPVEQVDFLLRILKYNKTVAEASGTELRVGIIYADNSESKKSYQSYDDALYEKVKIGENILGKKLTYSGILFSTGENFLKTMGTLEFAVFLIIEGNDDNLIDICNVAQAKSIMTFSGVKRYLNNGVASGVENIAGKNKVVINLESANSVGASFKAALLSIAKVIKS